MYQNTPAASKSRCDIEVKLNFDLVGTAELQLSEASPS